MADRYIDAAMHFFGVEDEDASCSEEHLAEIIMAALHLIESLAKTFYDKQQCVDIARSLRLAMEDISEN